MRAAAGLPIALLGAGAVLVGDAVARGGASVVLLVIVPVVFGASAEFLSGVVLLTAGLLTLPLLGGYEVVPDPARAEGGRTAAPPAEVGGVILLGPVPLFFGSWRGVAPRTRMALALVGLALLLVLVLAVLFLR
jgi:uncharacterized membrane protein